MLNGQITIDRPGTTTRKNFAVDQLVDVFSNQVVAGDIVTLHPGDYTTFPGTVNVPSDVAVVIMPGAQVEYSSDFRLEDFSHDGGVFSDGTHPLATSSADRYANFSGNVENIVDLNLGSEWTFDRKLEQVDSALKWVAEDGDSGDTFDVDTSGSPDTVTFQESGDITIDFNISQKTITIGEDINPGVQNIDPNRLIEASTSVSNGVIQNVSLSHTEIETNIEASGQANPDANTLRLVDEAVIHESTPVGGGPSTFDGHVEELRFADISGGEDITVNITDNDPGPDVATIDHDSAGISVSESGGFLSELDTDDEGHVTAAASGTIVTSIGSPGSDDNLATEQAIREAVDAAGGSGVTSISGGTDINVSSNTGAVTVNHDDTSTQGNVTVDPSLGEVIDNLEIDGRGHVTDIGTNDTGLNDRFLQLTGGTITGTLEVEGAFRIQQSGTNADFGFLDSGGTGVGASVDVIETAVGLSGDDNTLVTEKAVRDALNGIEDFQIDSLTFDQTGSTDSLFTGVRQSASDLTVQIDQKFLYDGNGDQRAEARTDAGDRNRTGVQVAGDLVVDNTNFVTNSSDKYRLGEFGLELLSLDTDGGSLIQFYPDRTDLNNLNSSFDISTINISGNNTLTIFGSGSAPTGDDIDINVENDIFLNAGNKIQTFGDVGITDGGFDIFEFDPDLRVIKFPEPRGSDINPSTDLDPGEAAIYAVVENTDGSGNITNIDLKWAERREDGTTFGPAQVQGT